jgi:catechol-2,3-dioxygenase
MISDNSSLESSAHTRAGPPPLRASLQKVTLESPDPSALAAFYARALGFSFDSRKGALIGSAHERHLTLCQGAAGRLSEACYLVQTSEDLQQLAQRLRAAGVEIARESTEDFADGVRFSDPDGNSLIFAAALLDPPANLQHGSLGMRAARLQHLVLASAEATRLIEFYREIVGFKISDVVLDEHGVMRTAFLNSGHEHHSLAVFAANHSRLDHFCFEASDWGLIRDWADHFSAERIPVQWGPGRHGPGNNLFVFIHDLDGNWVEVSAELENVLPDRPAGTWRHEERTLNVWGAGLLRS